MSTTPANARTILHIDMDAFYASVEVRDDPRLRDLPVIVGGHPTRGVVLTCTYEARKFGVRSAMPMVEAMRRCPDAIVVPPRMRAYATASRQVFEVLRKVTPLVEGLSLDEAFLDVTGSRAALGDGETIARALKQDVARATGGLTCSVGVASCKFVAKVASDLRKPDGLVVVPTGEESSFLEPLGVERLWGVGPKTAALLGALRIRKIADIQAISVERLAAAIGERGARHLKALAVGHDLREVDPSRDAKSIGSESTFDKDHVGAAPLREPLLRHAEEVARRLRANGLIAGALVVKVKLADHSLITRRAVSRVPLSEAGPMHRLALELLDRIPLVGVRTRLVGLSATDLAPEQGQQRELFAPVEEVARPRALGEALDAIEAKFGEGMVRRAGG